MINQIGSSQNPMQMMQQMFGNDPIFGRALQMSQGKSPQEIEQVMSNICQQRGLDYNQFKRALSQFGIKL